MYSIGPKLSRNTILFLTIALACGFASLVYWHWPVATPEAERGQTLKATTASMSRAKSQPTEVRRSETGRASWYSLASKTASGKQMDSDEMTAAHPSLPFGTQVEALGDLTAGASLFSYRVRAKSHSSRTTLALSSSRERRSRSSMLPSLSARTFECGRPQIVFEGGRCQTVIELKLCASQWVPGVCQEAARGFPCGPGDDAAIDIRPSSEVTLENFGESCNLGCRPDSTHHRIRRS